MRDRVRRVRPARREAAVQDSKPLREAGSPPRHAGDAVPAATFARPGLADTAFWLAAITALATPLFVNRDALDMFANPKELLLRGGGILVLGLLVARAIVEPGRMAADLRRFGGVALLAAGTVAWTAVTTLVSTNPALSAWTLLRVTLCAAIALAAVIGLARRGFSIIYLLLAPAVVNTIVLILQERMIWDPIYPVSMRPVRSALLGNSTWAGTYLLICAIVAAALTLSTSKMRSLNIGLTAVMVTGLVVTQSVASIGAFAVALVVMAALYSWRRAAAACLLVAIGGAVLVMSYEPARARARLFRDAVRQGNLNWLASNRLTPYASAYAMFLDRPLTGVGPGCYELQYFGYKIEAEMKYPVLRQSSDRIFNFGEAHNDHLQTMAVAGLPGYLLLLAALAFVGRASWLVRDMRRRSERAALVYALALPMSVAMGVVMLAQFPLELAATVVTQLFASAICIAWSRDAEGR